MRHITTWGWLLAFSLMACLRAGAQVSPQITTVATMSTDSTVCGLEQVEYVVQGLNFADYRQSDYGSNEKFTFAWEEEEGLCIDQGPGLPCDSLSTFIVEWENICDKGKVKCKVKYEYLDNNGVKKSFSVANLEHTVKIVPFSLGIMNISGVSEIACQDVGKEKYEASHCAHKYTWSVLGNWTLESVQNKKTMDIKPDGTSADTVVLVAEYQCANSLQPLLIATKPVTRGCPDNRSYTSASNSLPDHTAVKKDLIADASSGFIRVLNGQQVRFRAGESIRIEPDFEAAYGSLFQAKIAPCTDCLAFKHLREIEDLSNMGGKDDLVPYVICPNPSDGLFTIGCQGHVNPEDAIAIHITDLNGRPILQREVRNVTTVDIDLSSEPAGVYIIQLNTGGQSFVQRLDKN